MKSFSKRINSLSFLIAAGMTLTSIAYVIGCFTLNLGTLSLPAEGFVPIIVGILWLLGSSWLMVDALLLRRTYSSTCAKTERVQTIKIIMLLSVFFSYGILLSALGFILCTVMLLVTSAKIMGARWGPALLLAIGVTTICYILFILWLGIPFPPLSFYDAYVSVSRFEKSFLDLMG